jgi:hypothetical protein
VTLDPSQAIGIVKELIDLFKDLKGYFQPKHKVAYEALENIIRRITKSHQTMFQWANRFDRICRDPIKKKEDINKFSEEFDYFRDDPAYHEIKSLSISLCRIYDTMIKGRLRRIFSRNKKKYENAKHLFTKICNMGSELKEYAYSTLQKLEEAIKQINSNYDDRLRLEEEFIRSWEKDKSTLRQYIDELHNLQDEYDELIYQR